MFSFKTTIKYLFLLALFLPVCCYSKALNKLQDLRIWSSPENTKIVLDSSHKAHYRIFQLTKPYRVVVDLYQTKLALKSKKPKTTGNIKTIRFGKYKTRTRIVFDLLDAVHVKSFLLAPNQHYGHRLILDLTSVLGLSDLIAKTPHVTHQMSLGHYKPFVVMIDPGHGGEDPGAIGPRRTKEKDVVLAIAKQLYQQLKKQPGIKPVLTRSGDYYVGLQRRILFARKNKADLFISLHADAFRNVKAKGASVYTLSEHGASNVAARWLAKRANKADTMGGLPFSESDKVVASVLLNLSQTSTINGSREFAHVVLSGLRNITHLHQKTMQQANFHVLKAFEIPAVLIELGFISNQQEELKLRSKLFQKKMVTMLTNKIKHFAHSNKFLRKKKLQT